MLAQKTDAIHPRRDQLALRHVTHADVARIAELGGDWDVARMTSRIPYPYSEEAANHWVDDLEPGEIVHAITLDRDFIGICGMMPNDDGHSAEIGYWIGKPYWGRGYATLVGQQLVDMAFNKLRLNSLTAGHFTDNPVSGRVLEKLGFIPKGQNQCWCDARRREVDALRYELHKPKSWWQRLRQSRQNAGQ